MEVFVLELAFKKKKLNYRHGPKEWVSTVNSQEEKQNGGLSCETYNRSGAFENVLQRSRRQPQNRQCQNVTQPKAQN